MRIEQERIDQAKRRSPKFLWERWGFFVDEVSPNEMRVKNAQGSCMYRSTRKSDGVWISSMASAGVPIEKGVGDNITLWMKFERDFLDGNKLKNVKTGFQQAVLMLADTGTGSSRSQESAIFSSEQNSAFRKGEEKALRVPFETLHARSMGEAYLSGRGIGKKVMAMAEKKGILAFSEGSESYAPSVIFKGFDKDGKLRYASKRCMGSPKKGDYGLSKRDFTGSDKGYSSIFRGSDELVCLVEGGVNMLSVLQLFADADMALPTVLTTGGNGSRKWEKNELALSSLKKAKRVAIFDENDTHLDDESRVLGENFKQLQLETVKKYTDANVIIVRLPKEYNDINDMLVGNADMGSVMGQISGCKIMQCIEKRNCSFKAE